jgi:hypothetical protein
MSRRRKDPSYRLHKQSGQAIVTLPDGMGGRRDVLLGKHDSEASKKEYKRVLAEWESNGRRLLLPACAQADLTINELILTYWRFVETYYVKDGKPTSEQDTIRQASRHLPTWRERRAPSGSARRACHGYACRWSGRYRIQSGAIG